MTIGQTESIKIDAHILMGIVKILEKYDDDEQEHIVPDDIADMYVEKEKTKADK